MTTASLLAAGQAVPAPALARGLIDTGTDVSAVSIPILKRLGLSPKYQVSSQTVAGAVTAKSFHVSLSITSLAKAGAPLFVQPSLLVMKLPSPLARIDC